MQINCHNDHEQTFVDPLLPWPKPPQMCTAYAGEAAASPLWKNALAVLSFGASFLVHAVAIAFGLLVIYASAPQPLPPGTVIQVGLVSQDTMRIGTKGSATPDAAVEEKIPAPAVPPVEKKPAPVQPAPKSPSRAQAKPQKKPPAQALASAKTQDVQSNTAHTGSDSTAALHTGSAALHAGSAALHAGSAMDAVSEPVPMGGRVNPLPRYPELARQRGQEGKSVLLVSVDAQGNALGVQIRQSSGHALLDKAALKTVRGWKFSPALREGQPVSGEVLVPVDFRLQ